MPDPNDSAMAGKICLVTGATAGIGAVTARELARRGATVGIVGRSAERLTATVRSIEKETGSTALVPLRADLSSQAEIRRLAEEIRERFPRLDVLINNAGAMFLKRQESVDGIEMTFALNHLAYFLLTNLLLDRFKAAPAARIISVASDAHRMPKGLGFDDLQGRRHYGGFRAYARSKLANVLFAFELARRLEGTGVTSNALHPGFVASNFFTSGGMSGALARLMQIGARFFAINEEQGAATSIHLATAAEVAGMTGRYFEKRKPVRPSKAALDLAAARRLWEVSAEMTGLPQHAAA